MGQLTQKEKAASISLKGTFLLLANPVSMSERISKAPNCTNLVDDMNMSACQCQHDGDQ